MKSVLQINSSLNRKRLYDQEKLRWSSRRRKRCSSSGLNTPVHNGGELFHRMAIQQEIHLYQIGSLVAGTLIIKARPDQTTVMNRFLYDKTAKVQKHLIFNRSFERNLLIFLS